MWPQLQVVVLCLIHQKQQAVPIPACRQLPVQTRVIYYNLQSTAMAGVTLSLRDTALPVPPLTFPSVDGPLHSLTKLHC